MSCLITNCSSKEMEFCEMNSSRILSICQKAIQEQLNNLTSHATASFHKPSTKLQKNQKKRELMETILSNLSILYLFLGWDRIYWMAVHSFSKKKTREEEPQPSHTNTNTRILLVTNNQLNSHPKSISIFSSRNSSCDQQRNICWTTCNKTILTPIHWTPC